MNTPEYKAKMSEAKLGCIVSDETRKKISVATKGRVLSKQSIRKLKSSYYNNKKFYHSTDNILWHQIPINSEIGETLKSKLMEMFSCSYQVFAKYSNTNEPVRAGSAKGVYFKVE